MLKKSIVSINQKKKKNADFNSNFFLQVNNDHKKKNLKTL